MQETETSAPCKRAKKTMAKEESKNKAMESEQLAFHILEAFVEMLAQEAENSPGSLTPGRLKELVHAFENGGADAVLANFRHNLDDYLREHERDIWDQTRKKPFDRLLVKRISHLFPAEGELDHGGRFLSRRILPGLFMAIEMMAGPELSEQCHGASRGIVKAKREQHGANFRWRFVHEDPVAIELVNDLLAVVASHFADFEKRLEWLHELIDSHLAAADDYAFEGEAVKDWHFDTLSTIALLRALFSPFEAMLDDTDARQHIEERYGLNASRTIEDLVRHLIEESEAA